MKRKFLGLTVVAGAMLAGFVLIPSADAQTANVEAIARANAQQAAEAEADLGERVFGIPRAFNQAAIQKKYNDTYSSQMNAVRMQQGLAPLPTYSPYVASPAVSPYPYNYRMRTSGRILDYLF